MITLWTYKRAMGMPNASPFVMKVETYLRMRELEYERKVIANPSKAPKGKLPVIDDDGDVIYDSELIIEHLENKYAPGLDAELNAQQRATAHMLRRTLEENFYLVIVYSRWIEPEVWPVIREVWFGGMPPVVKQLATRMIQKTVARDTWGHGMGRHEPETVYKKGADDLAAVAQVLGDQPYIFGDQPHSIDAVVYSFVANVYHIQLDSPSNTLIKPHQNLMDYCDRMRDQYFPEIK